MHKLLERQLRYHFGSPEAAPAELRQFLEAVDASYRGHDDDRALVERSLEMTSKEMLQLNDSLRSEIEQRRDSEGRKGAILESALDPIILMDQEGIVREWNPASERVFGYPRAEAVGQPLADLIIPPSLRERHRQGLQHFLATGEGPVLQRRIEVTALRRHGSEFPVELAIIPFHAAGRTMFAGYLRDITDRKTQEESLRQAYARLQEVDSDRIRFLNTAAHELGTPLTPIRLQVHLVKSQMRTTMSEPQRKSMDILERNVERLGHLVRDLLDAARLQSGQMRLTARDADLAALAAQSADAYQPFASDAHVILDVHATATLPVRCDPERLGQVFDNLLANALKFTPAGGTVRIEARREGREAVVEVTDSGIGIAPDKLARLFLPFSQVHDTMQINQPGTGLGLYVSRGILEQSHGRIACESAGPGRGATFRVTLPLRT